MIKINRELRLSTNLIYKTLFDNYSSYKEKSIDSKFVSHSHIETLIKQLPTDTFQVRQVGKSIESRSIYYIKIGDGKTKVLAWSQMHGNEPTATQAIFDILKFFVADDSFNELRKELFTNITLYFVPMLNPDGAEKFERENAAGIDLNRDAIRLISPEAKILKNLHSTIIPDFAFNLHDQEGRYTVGKSSNSAIISFLAPPFNYEKKINPVRTKTMMLITNINKVLSQFIPDNTSKYSEDYEPRAFGDNFISWGTSSVLIESGGSNNKLGKQFQRKLNFVAIIAGLHSIAKQSYEFYTVEDYKAIPENEKLLFDILLKNVNYIIEGSQYKIDIGIVLNEKFDTKSKSFYYLSSIEEIGDLTGYSGYEELDCSGMLVEPGKISDKIYTFDTNFTTEQLQSFYSKGVTCLQTERIESVDNFSNTGINFVSNQTFNNKIKINSPSNLVIKSDNEIVYVIVNGFIYNVKQNTGIVSNGIIVK